MKLKNGAEYIESLKKIHPITYYKGKRIEAVASHPATAPHVRAAAMTYEQSCHGHLSSHWQDHQPFHPRAPEC